MSVEDKVIREEYVDCNGECYYVCRKVSAPYFQEAPLIPPLDFSFTLGSQKYYRTKLTKDGYFKKGKAYIEVNKAFKVGEIFQIGKFNKNKYYIKEKLRRRNNYGNFVFVIRRVDEVPMSDIDMAQFKKNVIIVLKGYYLEK